jgi:hypothetical protein
VPLDLSLYPAYPIRTKGFDSSIFKNYIGYVPGNVYSIPEQPVVPPTYTPYFVGNQFLTMVQIVSNKDRQHVIAPISTILLDTTSLLTYITIGFIHQPLDGGQPRDSPRGSSLRGDLSRGPFIPSIGSFGWLTPNPHMFIPPWDQAPIV